MGASVRPERTYSPDNPFAEAPTLTHPPVVVRARPEPRAARSLDEEIAIQATGGARELDVELARERGRRPPPSLIDSLIALTGGKRPGGGVSMDVNEIGGGEYDPRTDELWLSPTASREVIQHEYGHRYDRDGRLQRIVPSAVARAGTGRGQFTDDDESRSIEYAADAFQKAVEFLQSETSRRPPQDAASVLGGVEREHPGVAAVVHQLLQSPVYSRHPLKGRMPPPRAAQPGEGVVTAGPIEPLGIPAEEMARAGAGEFGLAPMIQAAIRTMRGERGFRAMAAR